VLSAADAVAVAAAYALGDGAVLAGPVAAGRLGDVWRLTTDRGAFAVKDARFPVEAAACERDAAYQDAARAGGVPMPAVVRDPSGRVLADVDGVPVRVYEWVDVAPLDRLLDPVAVGRVVAAIHRVEHPAAGPMDAWYAEPVGAAAWHDLVGRLRAAGAPYVERLEALLPGQLEVERLVEPSHDLRTCHNDLWADNVRRSGAGLVVLDWENSGPGDVSRELAQVLYEFGAGDAARMRTLAHAYAEAGGPGRVSEPADLSTLIAQTAHIAVEGCRRWLGATSEEDRADNQAWVEEYLDEPVTPDTVVAILDSVR
jgi:Ser/Thr protein kinase RdoA (MazF antagonist)